MSVSTLCMDGVVSLTLSRRASNIILRRQLCLECQFVCSLHKLVQVCMYRINNNIANSISYVPTYFWSVTSTNYSMNIAAKVSYKQL